MSTWTEADKNLVRTLWARGTSSGDIASQLHFGPSRNAVMGMINRLGLLGLGSPPNFRIEAMERIEEIFAEPFSLGTPLHKEALLSLCVSTSGPLVNPLALASGVARPDCVSFLEKLPLIWEEGEPMPERWLEGLEGVYAFILDMAFLSGSIDEPPLRRNPSTTPRLAA